MSGKSAHGRNGKVGYYEHNKKSKHQAALLPKQKQCDPFRAQAKLLEPEVWRQVKRFLLDADATREILDAAKSQSPESEKNDKKEQACRKIIATQNQMEALVERISRLPRGVDDALFMKQLEKLGAIKNDYVQKLLLLEQASPSDCMIPFEDFEKFTSYLREMLKDADSKPELQTAIIRKLVHRIAITPKGFEIEFLVGKEHLRRELGANAPGSVGLGNREPTDLFLKIAGSRRLTNGGPIRIRYEPL